MHHFLDEQIRRFLGENPVLSPEITSLLQAISQVYENNEQEQAVIKRSQGQASQQLTESYQALKQQADQSIRFQKAVESSTDGICISDISGEIVYANPTFERLLGYAPQQVLGRNIRDCAAPETKKAVLMELSESIDRGTAFHSDDVICRRNDNSTFWADFILYPVLDSGKASFMVVALHDVTQRKTMEQSKSEFVSLSSHQLRTPLTAVRWILDMFITGKTGGPLLPSQIDLLSDARNYTIHMMEMISTMLMISRIEGQKIQIEATSFSVLELLSELRKENVIQSQKKEQKLMIGCDSELSIVTDRKILKEILTNLVSNSIKYTPNNGLIHLAAWKEANKIYFELRDNGVGIPLYQQQKIFMKFFRGDNVMHNQVEGTGLGLYLVRQLTTLLRGSIHFTSEENKGTIFSLALPSSPLFNV